MVKKAVCLISGGLDSCVTAFITKKAGYDIYALTFCYGQKHKKEIQGAKNIASIINVKDHIFFDIDLSLFKGSSLIDKKLNPEKDHRLDEIGKKIPSTYVPARNTIFLSISLAFAESIDADTIFIGATSADYSGYPDCRPKYFEAFQKMADLSTKKSIEDKKITIKTPLINLSKSEIIKKGVEFLVPFEKTWSCYIGEKKACGRCDSCLLRLKGFKEAGLKDPIKYEYLPDWYI
ncbi:7-cyano-7-deazaguanine synthase [Thermoplasmatales archaeon SG8-52-4]|nr:MAG: 7-cyano-7-deazaguanine synthase [Thermoplasmatales archaeon SG8-52-4]